MILERSSWRRTLLYMVVTFLAWVLVLVKGRYISFGWFSLLYAAESSAVVVLLATSIGMLFGTFWRDRQQSIGYTAMRFAVVFVSGLAVTEIFAHRIEIPYINTPLTVAHMDYLNQKFGGFHDGIPWQPFSRSVLTGVMAAVISVLENRFRTHLIQPNEETSEASDG